MDTRRRIERALERSIAEASREQCPPGLRAAVDHAVFPGGARVRPLLCLGVAQACGDSNPTIADAAAGAIELLHCASLVHDDLPCFDDADLRRGKPSVHVAFGEPLAVLTGDALIILAFESLARATAESPRLLPPLLSVLARSVGMGGGLVAGQAWESEPAVPLEVYQAAKTGSLFVAAVKAGAVSSGADPTQWEAFGADLGEAYQVADDIRDASARAEDIGKPVRQDAMLGRPNAAHRLGMRGAVAYLETLVERALAAVPACPGSAELKLTVRAQVRWLVPKPSEQFAA